MAQPLGAVQAVPRGDLRDGREDIWRGVRRGTGCQQRRVIMVLCGKDWRQFDPRLTGGIPITRLTEGRPFFVRRYPELRNYWTDIQNSNAVR